MDSRIWWQLLLQLALIAFNAVFACAEIAVISFNDAKLASLAAHGDKRAERLQKLTDKPARFLATIQVAITLSGFLGSAFAAENFSDSLVKWLVGLGVGVSEATLNAVSVVVITLVLSYFTLVLGELVPKRVAMKKAEKLALGMSALITFISKVFAPIVSVLTASTNLMLRLFKIDPDSDDDSVSEEEIRLMVDAGSEKGVIDREEKQLINNVFEFDDLEAGEFVTHRTEVSMLWTEETDEQWADTIHESKHSLYPVCDGSADNIVGVLYAREYFRLSDKSRESVMREAVKPAFFVTQSVCADMLFKQMKRTRNRMAIVLDEYGGMLGIVTMTDLLEQLVGDFDEDQVAPTEPDIVKIDAGTWRVKGAADIAEVSEKLGVELDDGFDNFGSFVFSQYGYIPADGAQFELDAHGLHIKATHIADHRLESSVVCKI